jgi:hypothetical protein
MENRMLQTRVDYYAGSLLCAIGAGAVYLGSRYHIGSLTTMGPGFLPTCLGVALLILGVLVIATSQMGGRGDALSNEKSPRVVPEWRGWSCIISSVAVFIFCAEYAGLAPATFACVFLAASGDKQSRLKTSAILASGVTIFAVILFAFFLQVQVPVVKGF